MDITLAVFGTVFGLIFGALLGVLGANDYHDAMLKDCAKQHNVYECELVAVPKEKSE